MNQLRPLIVILGGIREVPVAGAKRGGRRFNTRRNPRIQGHGAVETRMRETVVYLYAAEKRAAHRFVKNANMILQKLGHSTPLGRIALAERLDDFLELRKAALLESIEHNSANPHWKILVELAWTPLQEDGSSQLLQLTRGKLPETFFHVE